MSLNFSSLKLHASRAPDRSNTNPRLPVMVMSDSKHKGNCIHKTLKIIEELITVPSPSNSFPLKLPKNEQF